MKRIIHVDMDAFYASIEQRDNPAFAGKPLVVGGDPNRRGVVAAASYEARAHGIHSAMSMARAVRMCPSLVIVHPDFSKYRAVSSQVFAIFREVTPLVEPLSLDEAYLDVTQNAWGESLATTVARRIKERIHAETRLTASAGVAPNKFLAKVASGWKKPDGLTVIPPERVEWFLHQLPVDALWGVGPVTARKLRGIGIERVVEVRDVPLERLREAVGSQALWLRQLAIGLDDREVEPSRPAKSSGSETTFAEDVLDIERLKAVCGEMVEDAARWLERHQLRARTVTLKVRYDDFTTITRSLTIDHPTCDAGEITSTVRLLLDRSEAGRRPVRLIGVSVKNFTGPDDAGVTADLVLPFD